MSMNKGERQQLGVLLRRRFKVLRGEVETRGVELHAELRERVKQRFAQFDKDWNDAQILIDEAVREANRKANDIIRAVYPDAPTDSDYAVVMARPIGRPETGRQEMLREGQKRIEAQVKTAMQRLEVQEADLLERLTLGALESDEAKAFFGEIPKVSELVPAERLLALEQSLNDAIPDQ
jgi:hypothetical protein